MNSTSIVDSYFAREEEFKDIESKSNKIFDIRHEISITLSYIRKMYSIIFKNFVNKKISTRLKLKQTSWGDKDIFFTSDGITIKDEKWGINTSNISSGDEGTFIRVLKTLKDNLDNVDNVPDIIKPLLREENYIKLKKFLERFDLVTAQEEFIKVIPQRKLIDWQTAEQISFILIDELRCDRQNAIRLIDHTDKENSARITNFATEKIINISGQSLQDKLIIEQIYDELVGFLNELIFLEETRLKNMKEYVSLIDKEFSNFVILAELSKSGKDKE